MPKGSVELTNARKEEIINACEELYKNLSFKEITIKTIGEATSFTRTSIYNYFETKEEIFLALFEREYRKLNQDLMTIIEENYCLSKQAYATNIATAVSNRKNLLKLLSMNLYDIEGNSRLEKLVDFKREYGRALTIIEESLHKFFNFDEQQSQAFVFSFFPSLFGIYPYAVATQKQIEAMQIAGVKSPNLTAFDLIFNLVQKLL